LEKILATIQEATKKFELKPLNIPKLNTSPILFELQAEMSKVRDEMKK
jgi:hypothetical protein